MTEVEEGFLGCDRHSSLAVMLNPGQEHDVSVTGKLSGPKGVHVS